jgi:hypothetical protein
MDWSSFLKSLSSPDVILSILNVILLIVASYMADWLPGFTGFSPRVKRLYMGIGCFILPVGAGILSGGTLMNVWPALIAGFAAFMANQAADLRNLSSAPKMG